MKDLVSPFWIKMKGLMFLLMGIVSGTLLVLETPNLRVVLMLALCVWSFCRAYYFAFYVIEKYVDPQFRFSGLLNFLVYLMRSRDPSR
jgi:hypothetical protein